MEVRYLLRRLLLLLPFACSVVSAQEIPRYTVTLQGSSATGFYFLCPAQTGRPTPDILPFHLILDGAGRVVYYRIVPTGNTGDFRLHPDGIISYYHGNWYYFLDSTFRVIDSVTTANGLTMDPHDFLILPNGNYLMMGVEEVRRDLRAYPYFNGNGSPGDSDAIVESVVIQELKPDGSIEFEWHAIDHFDFDDVDQYYLRGPSRVDWTHSNAIALDSDGNILLSSRHFNEITKIDRGTGEIIWRFGGKRNRFAVMNDPGLFLAQHDCQRIDNGNLTLFDNGRAGDPFHPAAAKEYELDETTMTATLAWSHVEDAMSYSRAIGNAQRLSNGNTLINYGLTINQRLLFNVVTPDNRRVFDLSFEDTLRSYRVYYYPDLPWRLNRPRLSCRDSAGLHYLDAGPGHRRYLWSTGDTTRLIPVTTLDTFVVHVPRGAGMIASEPFVVNDLADPCSVASAPWSYGVSESLRIISDPVRGRAILEFPESLVSPAMLTIVDVNGRIVHARRISIASSPLVIDILDLPRGLYFVRLGRYIGRLFR